MKPKVEKIFIKLFNDLIYLQYSAIITFTVYVFTSNCMIKHHRKTCFIKSMRRCKIWYHQPEVTMNGLKLNIENLYLTLNVYYQYKNRNNKGIPKCFYRRLVYEKAIFKLQDVNCFTEKIVKCVSWNIYLFQNYPMSFFLKWFHGF